MRSCFLIGHREANERLLTRLELEIERLIRSENVRYFYVGGYGGFDQIAATTVKRAKKKYPDITFFVRRNHYHDCVGHSGSSALC